MYEPLRIFILLLHKSWLVRKRHWIGTIIGEILVPIGLVVLIWSASSSKQYNQPPKEIKTDCHYRARPWPELRRYFNKSGSVKYSPNTDFVKRLMKNVQKCAKMKISMDTYASESHFLKINRGTEFYGIGVIFNESLDGSSKHLSYKFRYMDRTLPLFNEKAEPINLTKFYMENRPLAQLQICIDTSFIGMKSGSNWIPRLSIQRVPYPAHIERIPFDSKLRLWIRNTVVVSYMFPLFIETAKATNEKFVGVNVLMAMNGISNALNLLSWITSGFFFLSVFFGIPILLLLINSPSYGISFLYYGNPLLLYIILIFYMAHLLAFGIHISAYFSKSLYVTTALLMLIVLTVILQVYAFTDATAYLAPYFGILFPNMLFLEAMDEVRSYENIAEGIQWNNLFMNADPAVKIGGSVGMILILYMIGIIFHFLFAVYVYAILPGKYGVSKEPLYFLRSKPKTIENDVIESIKYDEIIDQYFETPPAGVYTPGIQIRNLKKTYNINLFTKQKVHALRGVSIDFYKGQITSLLGHNGAGKTTMMSILTGMMSPTDGIVIIDSKDLKINAHEVMKDLGLCTQDNMYFTSLTVSEQLLFFAKLKGRDKSIESIREDVKALLENLNLFEKKNALPNTLSGGQKRRLCLGMALVGNTSTLVLDEPTSGLDPESRRVIWDILLKMRGQKTVLISTHDMEEADILGDRIAIMHTGQLKSYGTSLFLKRLIGQNNVEITLSIEPRSDPEKIRSEIHKEGIIVSREASKMVVKIPNSPGLPDTLDNLEKKKKELGVQGFSVSLISLEQVFLKMTEENDRSPIFQQSTVSEDEKLTGRALHIQTVRALLSKKLFYTLKDHSTILIKILTIFTALVIEAIIMRAIKKLEEFEEALRDVNLELYHKPNVLYTSRNKMASDKYTSIIQSFGGNPIEVSDSNLESALLQRAKQDLVLYDNYLIAAAEINISSVVKRSSVKVFYSESATYSLPISINLVLNTVLKYLAGPDYSISIATQKMVSEFLPYVNLSESFGYVTALTFASIFCLTVAMFVVHPVREFATGMKHLQKMTGISGLNYWGTMFLFDLADYAFLVILIIIGFLSIDLSLGLRLFGPTEIFLEILLLLLFGINTLPFIYIFSFVKLKTSAVVRLAMYIPAAIVVMEVIMNILTVVFKDEDDLLTFRLIQKYICLLLPCVSFTHSQISYFAIVHANARCYRLPEAFYFRICENPTVIKVGVERDECCRLKCSTGKCGKSKPFFSDIDNDISLLVSVIYLCLTPILYFGILAVIESRFVPKFIRSRAKHDSVDPSDDEQVQKEKSMILQQIQTLKESSMNEGVISNGQVQIAEDSSDQVHQLFLTYELRKKYKKLKAVEDVSFGVNHGECFGLLGVNGAGKSTTFRMMTGAEIPDHGVMYLGDKDFESNEKYFLSQMGYCPQHDAILECLNSYHHLRLFARLRGIPEKEVENEVQMWLDKLNLNAYALQPSGTYSGGNKRRLNIGISLIGNPNLILMDEPTTGVDPGARRSLWNVIKACQKTGQSLVFTSHSMEECEALCNRLAIMVDGKLVCIGASEQLKQIFGAGYDIQIRMNAGKARDQVDRIKNDLALSLNCVLIDENLGYLMYHVAPTGTTWRKMYDVMNGMKKKYDCIDDFAVLSSSLEQLFLMFAKTASGNSSSQ